MSFQNITVLFNGNLYNRNSLKDELKLIGYKFKGESDTEVVVMSIYHWGNKAFNKFNGFFSIVYFNADIKKITLVRDRLGQKPLFYSQNQKSVFFGSTTNLIPKKFCGKLRKESIVDFITFGFVPSPNTMYENLFSVNPGSFIEFDFLDGKVNKTRSIKYWEPIINNEINHFDDATKLISTTISNSIKEGIEANVDVACLLSGGVDSSILLSKARKINEDIIAITADFGKNDEAKFRSSSVVNTLLHKNHIVKSIYKEDVEVSLCNTSAILDSPFDDTSIVPSNIIYSTVKNLGYSVALTGDGADEIFCGYSSFGNLKKLEPFLNKKFDLLRNNFPKKLRNFIGNYKGIDLAHLFMCENDLLTDLSCNGFKTREWGDIVVTDYDPLHYIKNILDDLDGLRPLDKLRILNLKFKLPNQMLFKVDRASMFNSVEARPLYLNNQIIDAALSISSFSMMKNGQKSILKDIYKSQIPNSGWALPKKGFGWQTESYRNIFDEKDNEYLKTATSIDGLSLLKNRKRHHKRGYYGLFSLNSWFKENSN